MSQKKTPCAIPKIVITRPQVIFNPQTTKKSFSVNPADMFDDTLISGIKDSYGSAVYVAADYDKQQKYLLPAYVDDMRETDWVPAVYSIFKDLPFSKSHVGYSQFSKNVINSFGPSAVFNI